MSFYGPDLFQVHKKIKGGCFKMGANVSVPTLGINGQQCSEFSVAVGSGDGTAVAWDPTPLGLLSHPWR